MNARKIKSLLKKSWYNEKDAWRDAHRAIVELRKDKDRNQLSAYTVNLIEAELTSLTNLLQKISETAPEVTI